MRGRGRSRDYRTQRCIFLARLRHPTLTFSRWRFASVLYFFTQLYVLACQLAPSGRLGAGKTVLGNPARAIFIAVRSAASLSICKPSANKARFQGLSGSVHSTTKRSLIAEYLARPLHIFVGWLARAQVKG